MRQSLPYPLCVLKQTPSCFYSELIPSFLIFMRALFRIIKTVLALFYKLWQAQSIQNTKYVGENFYFLYALFCLGTFGSLWNLLRGSHLLALDVAAACPGAAGSLRGMCINEQGSLLHAMKRAPRSCRCSPTRGAARWRYPRQGGWQGRGSRLLSRPGYPRQLAGSARGEGRAGAASCRPGHPFCVDRR